MTSRRIFLRITRNKTFADYASDEVLRWAVERQSGVSGDALRQVEKIDGSLVGQITGFRRIVDFRNLLARSAPSLAHPLHNPR